MLVKHKLNVQKDCFILRSYKVQHKCTSDCKIAKAEKVYFFVKCSVRLQMFHCNYPFVSEFLSHVCEHGHLDKTSEISFCNFN